MGFPLLNSYLFKIKITPGSRSDEYVETLPDGTIKIRLKAKAVDGKANLALLEFLEKETGKKWEIQSGFTSERKLLTLKK
ncbi:DUF167 domain-containing protein [Candidatus Gracilibacteria bacterium]|nr:DUF167 domain-containing protein [Candidatus Gracilibacteria bacterium]